MSNSALVWQREGLTRLEERPWLFRRLPEPAPLPESVPLPQADPPAGMDLVAVPTGVNNRNAAYTYTGGFFFDKRDFYIGAALIKHPQGDLLVESGFGRATAKQFATMPPLFQKLTKYEVWKPAVEQLEAADYDFDRLSGTLLTHAHWDHMRRIPDIPGLPVLVSGRDRAAFYNPEIFGKFRGYVRETPFNWQEFLFEGGPYLGFPRHHDVYGDGSIVCVPAPGQRHRLRHPAPARCATPSSGTSCGSAKDSRAVWSGPTSSGAWATSTPRATARTCSACPRSCRASPT
jgi:glyoxylase-like metal-dependent hydrolase (beta-lactamase superfamily II)